MHAAGACEVDGVPKLLYFPEAHPRACPGTVQEVEDLVARFRERRGRLSGPLNMQGQAGGLV